LSAQNKITLCGFKRISIAGFISFIAFFYSFFGAEASNPDTISYYQKSVQSLDKGNYEEAVMLAENGLKSKGITPGDKILYLRQIGLVYRKQSHWSKAEINFLKALRVCDSTDSQLPGRDSLKVELLLDLGSLHLIYSAQYNQALDYIITGVKISESVRDTSLMIRAYRLLAYVHRQLKDYTTSARYNGLSIDLARTVKDTVSLIYSLNELANVHVLTGKDIDSSMQLYNEALDYAVRASDKYCIAFINNDIGNLFYTMGDYMRALPYLRYAFGLNLDLEKFREVCIGALNIASSYFEVRNYDSTLFYLETGIRFAEKYNLRNEKMMLYNEMSRLKAAVRDFRDAYQFHLNYTILRDSIYNAEKEKLIAEITTKYETEKKDKENKLLRQQSTIHQLQAEKANANLRYVIITACLIIIFIMVFLWLLIRSNNQKKKTNEILNLKNLQINQQKDQLVETLHHLSQRERKLEEANATKDRFFSIIAHDLKNPFSGILGLSQLLSEDLERYSVEQQKQFIQNIHDSSDQVYKLLDNLLQWARTQLNQIDPKPEDVAIVDLIARCVKVHDNIASQKNIRVISYCDQSIKGFADPGMVDTVLRNLISNAIKFTPENGSVFIEANRSGSDVEISVRDTGTGISDDDIRKLFRIDKRLQKNGTSNENGTGLGLIICKEFVEKNGGSITVDSSPGKGSKFSFTLPQAQLVLN
jgi:signal transduction histidine kinase